MIIPFFFTFKSPALRKYASASSFNFIQILSSAVSGEILQVGFSFQNYVKVTYVTHFFNFKYVLQMFI